MARDSSGLARNSQRRGVTPLVLLLKRCGKISARSRTVVCAQQPGMDRRNAIGAVRAHDRQVCHADLVLRPFLDQAHSLDAGFVAGKAATHIVEETTVDLVDDLKLSRQHPLEVAQRPFLQRLGQQRVVRVGQGPPREVPRLLPPEMRLVEQDAHQLRHRQRRMGIIELDRDLVRQLLQSALSRRKRRTRSAREHATRKYSCAKRSPCPIWVESSGIQNAGQGLRRDAADQGAHEVARTELLEVEIVMCRSTPEPQAVDRLAAKTDHRPVVWDADQASRDGQRRSAGCPDGTRRCSQA